MNENMEKTAMKVSIISIIANVVLAAFKLVAGILAHSGAMISDAIHSASDVFSTFVVMIGIKIASKEPDEEHPYGHERMECVAAIILATILCITGLGIGKNALSNITGNSGEMAVPGMLALIAAIVSIIVKEAMFWYTRHYAKMIDSGALMADAWHHRSDALSSIAAFIGIGGAMLGFKILDPIATIIVAIVVVKVGINILKSSCDELMDSSISKEDIPTLEIILKIKPQDHI